MSRTFRKERKIYKVFFSFFTAKTGPSIEKQHSSRNEPCRFSFSKGERIGRPSAHRSEGISLHAVISHVGLAHVQSAEAGTDGQIALDPYRILHRLAKLKFLLAERLIETGIKILEEMK